MFSKTANYNSRTRVRQIKLSTLGSPIPENMCRVEVEGVQYGGWYVVSAK